MGIHDPYKRVISTQPTNTSSMSRKNYKTPKLDESTKADKARIVELEKALYKAEMKCRISEATIEIAEKKFDIEIKKKVQHEVIEMLNTEGYKVTHLCDAIGISRQAYYKSKKSFEKNTAKDLAIEFVREERVVAPSIGCEKLFYMAKDKFGESLHMGRDAFINLLGEYNLKVRCRKRKTKTTYSTHNYKKYPNIIKDITPLKANEVWVSDITYIHTLEGFAYLSLVTDLYSRKIVGWVLAPKLQYIHTEQALRNAIEQADTDLTGMIHHSDRGFQYCYPNYINLLKDNGIGISMTETSDPKENAVAERVNGILKQEWLNHMELKDITHAQEVLQEKIEYYNNRRPHSSLNYLTPNQAHILEGNIPRRWKSDAERYYEKQKSRKEDEVTMK